MGSAPPAPLLGRSIGYGRQSIDETDVEAVVAVLRGDWLTQGPAVEAFETALCAVTGAGEAVAVNSGTAALHLALSGLDIGPGSTVVTSPNTFLASATAALWCGAEVEFVDIEDGAWTLDLDQLEQRLERGGVDAVVAVDFAGAPCDRERLLQLRERHGFRLVMDACHSLGASTSLGPVGGEHGVDATCLSFHPVKHVTTGEGGALLCHDPVLAARARSMRSHGIDRDSPAAAFGAPAGERPAWFAPMEALGLNYRLCDLGAALGTSQLARLGSFVERRRDLARRYDRALRDAPGIEVPELREGHAWHLYVVHVDAARRDALMAELAAEGIGTQVHYHPVPLQPWFLRRYGRPEVPRAERHARTALSLPMYPGLSDEEQDAVIEALARLAGSGR